MVFNTTLNGKWIFVARLGVLETRIEVESEKGGIRNSKLRSVKRKNLGFQRRDDIQKLLERVRGWFVSDLERIGKRALTSDPIVLIHLVGGYSVPQVRYKV